MGGGASGLVLIDETTAVPDDSSMTTYRFNMWVQVEVEDDRLRSSYGMPGTLIEDPSVMVANTSPDSMLVSMAISGRLHLDPHVVAQASAPGGDGVRVTASGSGTVEDQEFPD